MTLEVDERSVRAQLVRGVAEAAKAASRVVARATAQHRTRALIAISEAIYRHRAAILAANATDVAAAREAGVAPALLDRLLLDDKRITGLARAVADIAAAPEILGRVERTETRPNGLEIQRVRIPLGVIAMIYEARPNVTDRRGGPVPQGRQRVHPARRPRGAREQPRPAARGAGRPGHRASCRSRPSSWCR